MNMLLFNERIHASMALNIKDMAAIESFRLENPGAPIITEAAQREALRRECAFVPHRAYVIPSCIIRDKQCMDRVYAQVLAERGADQDNAESQHDDVCLICGATTNCGAIDPMKASVYLVKNAITRHDARIKFNDALGVTPDIRIHMLACGYVALMSMTLCGLCNFAFGYDMDADELRAQIEYVCAVDAAWFINSRPAVLERAPSNFGMWRDYVTVNGRLDRVLFVWRVLDSFPDEMKKFIQYVYV